MESQDHMKPTPIDIIQFLMDLGEMDRDTAMERLSTEFKEERVLGVALSFLLSSQNFVRVPTEEEARIIAPPIPDPEIEKVLAEQIAHPEFAANYILGGIGHMHTFGKSALDGVYGLAAIIGLVRTHGSSETAHFADFAMSFLNHSLDTGELTIGDVGEVYPQYTGHNLLAGAHLTPVDSMMEALKPGTDYTITPVEGDPIVIGVLPSQAQPIATIRCLKTGAIVENEALRKDAIEGSRTLMEYDDNKGNGTPTRYFDGLLIFAMLGEDGKARVYDLVDGVGRMFTGLDRTPLEDRLGDACDLYGDHLVESDHYIIEHYDDVSYIEEKVKDLSGPHMIRSLDGAWCKNFALGAPQVAAIWEGQA